MWRQAPFTLALIVSNLAIFAVQMLTRYFGDPAWFADYLALSHWGLQQGYWWQLLTYAWLHSETLPIHILFNMLMVYNLGVGLEQELGGRRFLTLYGAGVLGAAIIWLIIDRLEGVMVGGIIAVQEHVVAGASGAVFALLLGFAALHPSRTIQAYLFFILPLRGRMIVLAWSIMAVELVCQIFGFLPYIAHTAHLGGGVVGWFLGRRYFHSQRSKMLREQGYFVSPRF